LQQALFDPPQLTRHHPEAATTAFPPCTTASSTTAFSPSTTASSTTASSTASIGIFVAEDFTTAKQVEVVVTIRVAKGHDATHATTEVLLKLAHTHPSATRLATL
jgi:hypothetical protein